MRTLKKKEEEVEKKTQNKNKNKIILSSAESIKSLGSDVEPESVINSTETNGYEMTAINGIFIQI